MTTKFLIDPSQLVPIRSEEHAHALLKELGHSDPRRVGDLARRLVDGRLLAVRRNDEDETFDDVADLVARAPLLSLIAPERING